MKTAFQEEVIWIKIQNGNVIWYDVNIQSTEIIIWLNWRINHGKEIDITGNGGSH